MVLKEQYEKGGRCRSICQLCSVKDDCYQYEVYCSGIEDLSPKIDKHVVRLTSSDTIGNIFDFVSIINKTDDYNALVEEERDENGKFVINIKRN